MGEVSGEATQVGGAPDGRGSAGAGAGINSVWAGGDAAGVLEPPSAGPRDLEAVRARIARTLAYPSLARKLRWQGRCVVEFVLLASGAIRAPCVREGTGHAILDAAALAAVRAGAPYPAPGADVRIATPVTFSLQ
jgi:TonB family protein